MYLSVRILVTVLIPHHSGQVGHASNEALNFATDLSFRFQSELNTNSCFYC